ncbi:iron complex transport system ATP-binding protein [Roseomonas rosea]|uniref:Iron complex transport system ATP-binding protein n=1 Tax=Muricoccus roseus TaxID=198092 RepID=A0A1M6D3V5_9PROT|nr:heme ABC transporter ATP-binding protein [Roseomonas rosea]SHI67962.1 iron complex transport system ATP-binding protein [Roseomonas rosea]
MITGEGLSLRRGGRALLRDVSVQLAAGEVLAVVGPNGAGKSTLLRLLCGDLRPDAGVVLAEGRALPAWRPLDLARRRAVMTQHANLAFPMSARAVVGLGRLPWHGHPGSARDEEAVREAMARAGVLPLAARAYATLSGGEQQRVQLARALAQLDGAPRPAALLLDEPTASLDVAHRVALLRILRELAGEGLAVMVILHDLNEAAIGADRVLMLRDGAVAGQGSVAEVLDPPRLREVYGLDFRRLPDGLVMPDYGAALGP